MINRETERREQVLDKISNGAIDGRGLTTMANPIAADASFVASLDFHGKELA